MEHVDVVAESERRDVGLEAVEDRARLLAGSAVGLLELDALAGLLQPMGSKERVVVGVEFARRIVGNVEELDGLVGARGGTGARATRKRDEDATDDPRKYVRQTMQ